VAEFFDSVVEAIEDFAEAIFSCTASVRAFISEDFK